MEWWYHHTFCSLWKTPQYCWKNESEKGKLLGCHSENSFDQTETPGKKCDNHWIRSRTFLMLSTSLEARLLKFGTLDTSRGMTQLWEGCPMRCRIFRNFSISPHWRWKSDPHLWQPESVPKYCQVSPGWESTAVGFFLLVKCELQNVYPSSAYSNPWFIYFLHSHLGLFLVWGFFVVVVFLTRQQTTRVRWVTASTGWNIRNRSKFTFLLSGTRCWGGGWHSQCLISQHSCYLFPLGSANK